jgi:hypothetical protein
MGSLLHTYFFKYFVGIIVGNELLFRRDLIEAALAIAHGARGAALGDLFRNWQNLCFPGRAGTVAHRTFRACQRKIGK